MPGKKNEREKPSTLNLESVGIDAPYNMQAEQALLGAALLDPGTVLTEMMGRLQPDMFYYDKNRVVFTCMSDLFAENTAVDLVTLMDRVGQNAPFTGLDDAKIYLASLAETVPSISNADTYASIVEDKYRRRQVQEAAKKMLEQSNDGADADLLLESAEQSLYDIRNGRSNNSLTMLRDAIVQTITNLQKLDGPDRDKYAGVPTGFNYLDNILSGGMGHGDLIILAARPGMGKTSFALNIATNVAKNQKIPTAVFSLEMTCDQLTDRILSSEAQVDSQAFRTGKLSGSDWDDLIHTGERLFEAPIFMDDTSGITVPEMKAKLRRLNQDPDRDKIGLVVVDYLQLMSGSKRTDNRVQEISEITRNLKIMAKEMNVPVIALSQLSRAVEKQSGGNRRPQLSDLRDSGSIEQDADVVLFLFRGSYYTQTGSKEESSEPVNENEAECIVAKNRHGEVNTVKIGWDGAHTRFYNVDFTHER